MGFEWELTIPHLTLGTAEQRIARAGGGGTTLAPWLTWLMADQGCYPPASRRNVRGGRRESHRPWSILLAKLYEMWTALRRIRGSQSLSA